MPSPDVYTNRHPRTRKNPHRDEWLVIRKNYHDDPAGLSEDAGITMEQARRWLDGDGGPSPVQLACIQSRLARG